MALNPTDLANAIQKAFPQAWLDRTQTPAPMLSPSDKNQQLAFFLAIAHGLLSYLNANQKDAIVKLTLTLEGGGTPGTFDASNLALNITGV